MTDLERLLDLYSQDTTVQLLQQSLLADQAHIQVSGLAGSGKSFVLSGMMRNGCGPWLIIMPDKEIAAYTHNTLAALLPDADIRGYLDANDLTVVANEVAHEHRDMQQYLDLVGLEGEARERVARMAPESYDVELGWYVAVKHG